MREYGKVQTEEFDARYYVVFKQKPENVLNLQIVVVYSHST